MFADETRASEFVSRREAKDHCLIAGLRPPDDGMAGRIWTAKRVAQRGGGNVVPNIVDPDLIVVARYTPILFGKDVTVCKLATPSAGNRMLVLEPSVKRSVKIGGTRRSRKAWENNDQECNEPKHAFGLLRGHVMTASSPVRQCDISTGRVMC
jgi:hypothetical protein